MNFKWLAFVSATRSTWHVELNRIQFLYFGKHYIVQCYGKFENNDAHCTVSLIPWIVLAFFLFSRVSNCEFVCFFLGNIATIRACWECCPQSQFIGRITSCTCSHWTHTWHDLQGTVISNSSVSVSTAREFHPGKIKWHLQFYNWAIIPVSSVNRLNVSRAQCSLFSR